MGRGGVSSRRLLAIWGEQFHQSGEGERDGSVSCGGKRREEVVVGSAGKVLKRSAA